MRKLWLLAGVLAGGCGSSNRPVTVTTPSVMPEAFECLATEFKKQGYRILRTDVDDRFFEAQKQDAGAPGGPDVQIVARGVHVQITGRAADGQTGLDVLTRSYADRRNYRGQTIEFGDASPEQQAQVLDVVRACGTSG